jgi:hypothetical protein
MREAMASELKGRHLGSDGETVEIDGGYFGGYVKPSNRKENRRDRRLTKNQNGKRQVVVVVRERGGSTLPAVFKSESAAQSWIALRVTKGTKIVADEASSWNGLEARFQVDRIDHSQAYSLDGIYSNGAESYFSRLRRAEIGHHHHIAGAYLAMLRKARGGRIIAGWTTAPRFVGWLRWRWLPRCRLIGAGIGSGRGWRPRLDTQRAP